ncbi:MAG: ABC transporter permease [Acidobacteriota bacterium]
MKHPLNFLLRLGRSDADRAALLGDLEQERRARRARGCGWLSTFLWQTGQIFGAWAYGVRDAICRRASHGVSWPDLKPSVRLLFKYPGLTLVSGLGIAVGIAIPTGFFAFIHSQLYPTLPLDEGDRIVAFENWRMPDGHEDRHLLHDFVTWREQMTSVVDIGAFWQADVRLRSGALRADMVRVAVMTASGFTFARVPPLMGRFLTPDDERPGADPVVVIGYDAWRSRFAQDPSIVGKQVRLGTTLFGIVGVMPEGFKFPVNHQFWVALRASPQAIERGAGPAMFVFGRLAPGATVASAQAELATIGDRTAAAFPKTHANLKPHLVRYTHSIIDAGGPSLERQMFRFQLVMSLAIVVVALNVAILVYARTATRRRELAIRTALGAGRLRIVMQLFGEALALAIGPAIAGLFLAQYGLSLGLGIVEHEFGEFGGGSPFWADYSVQPATIGYVLALVVLAAAIVGVLPAIQATRSSVAGDIRHSGGAGTRLGRAWAVMIVAQVAIAVAALPTVIRAGLSGARGSLTRPAYPIDEFLELVVTTEGGKELLGHRLTELKRSIQIEPDVAGVTLEAWLPGRDGARRRVELMDAGAPIDTTIGVSEGVRTYGIDTDYLSVYGLRVLAGRAFDAGDAGNVANPVIVDRSFVRAYLNDEPAVGRRFRYAAGAGTAEPSPWHEIVGVVENMSTNPIDPDVVRPYVFYPAAGEQLSGAELRVHVRGPAAALLQSDLPQRLINLATTVDPALRLGDFRASAASEAQETLIFRLVGSAVLLIMVTVLLLSAAGVYALMSLTVTQRRREIGIRTALGAPRHRVLRSVFSRVALQIGAGVLVGIAGAVALQSPAAGLGLYGSSIIVIPAVAVIMLLVGFFAAFGPARRGLSIQPTEALRAE